jgi:hypothetical protein
MIGGIPLAELNALELQFLFALNFDLALSPDLYARRARALLPSSPDHPRGEAWRPPDQLRMDSCREPLAAAAADPPRLPAASRRSTAAASVECATDDSDWPRRPLERTAAAAESRASASPPPGGPASPDAGLPGARPACRRPAWLAGIGPDAHS